MTQGLSSFRQLASSFQSNPTASGHSSVVNALRASVECSFLKTELANIFLKGPNSRCSQGKLCCRNLSLLKDTANAFFEHVQYRFFLKECWEDEWRRSCPLYCTEHVIFVQYGSLHSLVCDSALFIEETYIEWMHVQFCVDTTRKPGCKLLDNIVEKKKLFL